MGDGDGANPSFSRDRHVKPWQADRAVLHKCPDWEDSLERGERGSQDLAGRQGWV